MARFPSLSAGSWSAALLCSFALFSTLIPTAYADDFATLQGTNAQGVEQTLLVDRTPALYTGDFGDCMNGQSLLNLTSFDAAYYADNMTVLFNLAGTTSLRNESLMLYISVQAYGEDRFDLVFNPCNANFNSLCPLNASVPVEGQANIPVSVSDVSGIPSIALVIPDFEGQAILRVFSNATQTQIGCFAAEMRNGASFSHPAAVGSVLGIFTFVAVMASFFTAIYGMSVPHIRTHYAHSLSVLVVFEVFQAIFFSGALSLNWPSVLTAWWSNFAWSAGMIYTPMVINSVNKFTGITGNSSQVGGAGSSVINNNGGLQQQIYGRGLVETTLELGQRAERLARRSEGLAGHLYKRAANTTDERMFAWAGLPASPGLPLPGNWTDFAGTLSEVNIPAADAFMVGLIWFLVLIACLIGAILIFKYSLEGLSRINKIQPDRFGIFRKNWLSYLGLIILRTSFIAFFMFMTLTLFQFSYGGKAGPIAIAVIFFLIFFVGALGTAFYACFYRVKFGKYETTPDPVHFQRKKVMKFIPWVSTVRESRLDEESKAKTIAKAPFFATNFVDPEFERVNVHQDENYTKKFGWLSARYRRTRWWFFAFWVVYQFVRACFVGGARAHPTAQVIGLFVWEVLAFVAIICINPFEGARNTALAVWMLSLSKIATAGLSIAFLDQLNVPRIPTTVIGVIIIVIQGFLVIGLLILIVLGAISSYISITRNRDGISPHALTDIRLKYFAHLETKEKDVPPPPPPVPEEPREPYFSVNAVRRAPKIEDEDEVDFVPDLDNPSASRTALPVSGAPVGLANRASRANSMANSMRSNHSAYGSVPFGARVHRASWSSRDFQNFTDNRTDSPVGTPTRTTSGMSRHGKGETSISMVPLVRPQQSQTSLSADRPRTPTRVVTPTRDQQMMYQDQRIQGGKNLAVEDHVGVAQ